MLITFAYHKVPYCVKKHFPAPKLAAVERERRNNRAPRYLQTHYFFTLTGDSNGTSPAGILKDLFIKRITTVRLKIEKESFQLHVFPFKKPEKTQHIDTHKKLSKAPG